MKLVLHNKFVMKHQQKYDLYPNLVMIIENVCLLIPQLDT